MIMARARSGDPRALYGDNTGEYQDVCNRSANPGLPALCKRSHAR